MRLAPPGFRVGVYDIHTPVARGNDRPRIPAIELGSGAPERVADCAREDAHEWWKGHEGELPGHIQAAIAKVGAWAAPFPKESIIPPRSNRGQLRAAWTREHILQEFERRQRLERSQDWQRYH